MTSFKNVSTNSRLLDFIKDNSLDEYTTTQNNAITFKSSGSAVLDFFSRASAIRNKNAAKGEKVFSSSSEERLKKLFRAAINEDFALSIVVLFYIRDIRNGQGERELFRILIKDLAKTHPVQVNKLISFFPELGRWDDLFALKGTRPYIDVLEYIRLQLIEDIEVLRNASDGDIVAISLCAKWMPSEFAGKKSKHLARELAYALKLSMQEYRQLLSVLRQHLHLVEIKMCERKWNDIDYSKLPSRASFMYRKAFKKHDEARYVKFIEDVKLGKSKINSATLYPYEIVQQVMQTSVYNRDESLEQLWYALPNYINQNHKNSIAVVDVSGSMSGTPMAVAVSLGMYLAERNTNSIWKDHFITFETSPHLIEIKGGNFTEKVHNVLKAPWDGSTDLQAVFDLILNTAKKARLSKDELPEVIYIISDMEFNQAVVPYGGNKKIQQDTNLNIIRGKYKKFGYEMPKLVFWNVNSTTDQSPAKYDDKGVALFSGLSATIFKAVLSGDFNPLTSMLEVLLVERYLPILQLMRDK